LDALAVTDDLITLDDLVDGINRQDAVFKVDRPPDGPTYKAIKWDNAKPKHSIVLDVGTPFHITRTWCISATPAAGANMGVRIVNHVFSDMTTSGVELTGCGISTTELPMEERRWRKSWYGSRPWEADAPLDANDAVMLAWEETKQFVAARMPREGITEEERLAIHMQQLRTKRAREKMSSVHKQRALAALAADEAAAAAAAEAAAA